MNILSKISSTLFLMIVFFHFSLGQETQNDSLWSHKGTININFSNVGLSDWAAGGESSIALGGIIDAHLTRNSEQSSWDNYVNLAYGITRVGGSGRLFKKTDDQLLLGSKYAYKFNNPKWSLSAGFELRTQTQPGFEYAVDTLGNEFENQIISEFFAPAFLNLNLGIQYKDKYADLTLAPTASKVTFVLHDSLANAGAFGVEAGKNIRTEFGANFNGKLEFPIAENISFKTILNLFTNYETLDLIDVNWSTLLSMKVNKYITTTFGTELIYDHDILIPQADGTSKQAVQFKHVLNVNVGIAF